MSYMGSGAFPVLSQVSHKFSSLTKIKTNQGYDMQEAEGSTVDVVEGMWV